MSKFGGNSRNVRSNIHNFERRNPYLVCHVLATIASAKLKFLWGGPQSLPVSCPSTSLEHPMPLVVLLGLLTTLLQLHQV